MLDRYIENQLIKAFNSFKAVYLTGARQVGKTTLVQQIAKKLNISYITLDDSDVLQFAKDFPKLFFKKYKPPLVIDEVQNSEDIIMEIKQLLDKTHNPKTLLLTGSTDFMRNKKIRESLAGRFISLKLYPLSETEINKSKPWIDKLFKEQPEFSDKLVDLQQFAEKIYKGYFPPIRLQKLSDKQIRSWFDEYLQARILKDIQLLDEIRKADKIRMLLKLIAWQSGNLMNISNLARNVGVSMQTIEKYFALLQGIFLVELLKPYLTNISKREVKMPKVYMIDTGLMAYLNQIKPNQILSDRTTLGKLTETWVYSELRKELSYSENDLQLYFFRDDKKNEIDFLIENQDGTLAGIEVKAKERIKTDDIKHLKIICKKLKPKLKQIFIIYFGDKFLPVKNLCPTWLLPIANLL